MLARKLAAVFVVLCSFHGFCRMSISVPTTRDKGSPVSVLLCICIVASSPFPARRPPQQHFVYFVLYIYHFFSCVLFEASIIGLSFQARRKRGVDIVWVFFSVWFVTVYIVWNYDGKRDGE